MLAILARVRFRPRDLVSILVFVLLSALAQMAIPVFLSIMIDKGVAKNDESLLLTLAAAMVVLAIAATVTRIAAVRVSSRVATDFSSQLRAGIFRKVQTFSSPEIDKFGTASLIMRNTSDVTAIQNFLIRQLQVGMYAAMMAVAGVIFSVVTAGKIAIVLVTTIPVMIVVLSIVITVAAGYSAKLRRKIDEINKLFLETLEGVRVIRAFNKQDFEVERFQRVNEEATQISRKANMASSSLFPIVYTLFGIATVAVMAVGTKFVVDGAVEIGTLVAAAQYITIILVSIMLEASVISLFPDAYACMKRIGAVLSTDSAIQSPEKERAVPTACGTVEFRNVTFAYPGAEEPVIKGISFFSGPGETTAIIGRTGCGKSSLVKLIPRLYDTLFGDVLVDGVNVKDYSVGELRKKIGYVPQKNVLFSGDIASNLNFGKENGTEEDWEEAVRIACAKEFVTKKDGTYHSTISQGGTNLSGGQRQRLAIARAVMKKPEVYIFDDSFSALDMKTDRELRANLGKSTGNATVIVVAQRVSSIVDATRILVLDRGEVVGMGTHRELLRSCSLYREIAEIQMGKEAVEREANRL